MLGRLPAVQGRSDFSGGICLRPSRITTTTVLTTPNRVTAARMIKRTAMDPVMSNTSRLILLLFTPARMAR